MHDGERGMRAAAAAAVTALVLLIVFAGYLFLSKRGGESVKFETPYQAVLLTNGSVYFGKLEGAGSDYPVLRDVFYVQSSANPETKQVTNILVRRGKEWHAPDRMILNARQIVLIEPVGPESKVAQLISEAKKQ